MTPHNPSSPERDARENHHVYGAKSALTVEIDSKRSGMSTISIDAAPKAGEKSVNWSEKIRFQLTASELPILAGIFLGYVEEVRFDFHGTERNKSLHVVHRGQNILVRVMEGATGHAVPMAPGDVYATGLLILKALTNNHPGLEVAAHMSMVRMACKLWLLDTKNASAQQQGTQRGAASR